jgi:hypothetical protein
MLENNLISYCTSYDTMNIGSRRRRMPSPVRRATLHARSPTRRCCTRTRSIRGRGWVVFDSGRARRRPVIRRPPPRNNVPEFSRVEQTKAPKSRFGGWPSCNLIEGASQLLPELLRSSSARARALCPCGQAASDHISYMDVGFVPGERILWPASVLAGVAMCAAVSHLHDHYPLLI